MVNSPDHYNNNWEVGDFIRSQKLNFHLGNAIKYICRADHKGSKKEDLQKAIHYLENELSTLQNPITFGSSDSISDGLWNGEFQEQPDYATGFNFGGIRGAESSDIF